MVARKDSGVDFVVLGGGIAGMRAAIELARGGRVLVLTKDDLYESSTEYAQGGIAAALGEDDEVTLHLHDTLLAGDGLCREEAVRVLVEEGPEQIHQLIEWGMRFDRNGTKLAFTREGAHSRSRVLHAHGDSTGSEILRALMAKARTLPSIQLQPHTFATELVVEDGKVCGVTYLDAKSSAPKRIPASAVLLATGGLGHVYKETTNPSVACGDGVAMAYRAGALLSDMEFVQFHPTALFVKGAPRFLLSEALRGEGAYLRNLLLERFMPRYHEAAELAPRDVVARAIILEMQKTRGGVCLPGPDGPRPRACQEALPANFLHLPEVQHRYHRGPGSDSPRGPLRHGRRGDGPARRHFAPGTFRRRRSRLHRCPWRQPLGQ